MPLSPDAATTVTPMPLTRTEFARRTGRAKSSVTEACAGPLRAAVLPTGALDAQHPDVAAWCAARGIDHALLLAPGAPASPHRASSVTSTTAPAGSASIPPSTPPQLLRSRGPSRKIAGPANIEELGTWTLDQLMAAFGSADGFGTWLDDRKKVAEIARLESRLAREQGRLISRELVRLHCFGALQKLHHRLLMDAAATLAVRIGSSARAGATREELTKVARDLIGSELAAAKRGVAAGIRDSKTGDNPPPVKSEEHNDDESDSE
jgi:hypothetical protein